LLIHSELIKVSRSQSLKNLGSYSYAKETATLIRDIFKQTLESNFKSVDGLLEMISKLQKMLTATNSIEFSIENIIKRVTSIVKEQAKLLNLEVTEIDTDHDSRKLPISLNS
jgi:translation initiation factor 2B subunit (eIF-2B alpha/beta/delta family)